MKEAVLSSICVQKSFGRAVRRKSSSGKWKYVLAASFLTASLFACAGLFISGFAYFNMFENAKFSSRAGALLISLSALLFFSAAHSLDMIDLLDKNSGVRREQR